MKTSELITILNKALTLKGDQNLVIMVHGKEYTDIEVYIDEGEESYLEGYGKRE